VTHAPREGRPATCIHLAHRSYVVQAVGPRPAKHSHFFDVLCGFGIPIGYADTTVAMLFKRTFGGHQSVACSHRRHHAPERAGHWLSREVLERRFRIKNVDVAGPSFHATADRLKAKHPHFAPTAQYLFPIHPAPARMQAGMIAQRLWRGPPRSPEEPGPRMPVPIPT
jgi:hypothetical protein